VPGQPGVVLREVGPDRADEDGPEAQQAQPVRHVGAGSAAVLDEVVHQEGERDVLHLALDELLDELPGEGHQVVGGDGAGDDDGHGTLPLDGSAEVPREMSGATAAEQRTATL
jgi:hypothetical protein